MGKFANYREFRTFVPAFVSVAIVGIMATTVLEKTGETDHAAMFGVGMAVGAMELALTETGVASMQAGGRGRYADRHADEIVVNSEHLSVLCGDRSVSHQSWMLNQRFEVVLHSTRHLTTMWVFVLFSCSLTRIETRSRK